MNYPAGSMRGSGIYATDRDIELQCTNTEPPCDFDGTVTVTINDDGVAHGECPKCGASFERDEN